MAPSNTRMRYVSFSFLQMKYILFVAGNTVINGDIKMCQATENKIRLCHLGRKQLQPGKKVSDSQNQIRSGWKIFAQPAWWVKKRYPLL